MISIFGHFPENDGRDSALRVMVFSGIDSMIVSTLAIRGEHSMSGRKFSRILVAIADPSAGMNKALRRASMLARDSGASIDLFNAIPSAMSEGTVHAAVEHFTRLEAEQNHRQIERTANRLRREEIVVTTKVQTGFPVHEAILRHVRLTKPDLVVIEAHKHNVFARLLLTQTDFELIRRCPVPLLIVKGRTAWRRPRILAALDPFHINDKPTALDGEIIDAARAVAAAVGGFVHAGHIYRPFGGLVPGMPISRTTLAWIPAQEKAYKVAVRRRFYETLSRYGIGKNNAHLICGDPASELPVLARSMRARLVVMGAMSRSGLKRIFIGNTAEHALDSLQCDVLVVKPQS
jgi:universal stress protein E